VIIKLSVVKILYNHYVKGKESVARSWVTSIWPQVCEKGLLEFIFPVFVRIMMDMLSMHHRMINAVRRDTQTRDDDQGTFYAS